MDQTSTDIKNEPQAPIPDKVSAEKKHLLVNKNYIVPFIIIIVVVSFLAGLLIAYSYFQKQVKALNYEINATNMHATKKLTQIVIGTDASAYPMEYINANGQYDGFDIDLAKKIASEIGVKAVFVNVPWSNIFTSLQSNKVDMIISSITITDQREQSYIFSDPYLTSGQVIISRKDDPITSLDQLKGIKISVNAGTTSEQEALKYSSPGLVVGYKDLTPAAQALSEGKTDAMVTDLTLATGITKEFSNLEVTTEPFTNEYYGIVFRKNEESLQDQVNDAMTTLQVNGYISDLKQEWIE